MTGNRLTVAAGRAAKRLRDRFGVPSLYVRGDSSIELLVWPYSDSPTVDAAGGNSPGRIDADGREWCFLAADLADAAGCQVRPEEGDRIVVPGPAGESTWEVRPAVGGPLVRFVDATEFIRLVYSRRV